MTALDFLPQDGEVARLIRQYDWSATPLGPPSQWSASLRMVVRFMLANRFPHLLWWGPDYVQIYNDHYIPILGSKHPQQALGKPFRECWHEVYHILGPLVDTPFNGGPATWMEDIELIVRRNGFPEESHFMIAYSAVPDDTAPRGIGGVLGTVHEITEKVIAERRVKILSELSARVAGAKTDVAACERAIEILAQYAKDVPFALLYLVDEAKRELRLVSTTGVPAESVGPKTLDLGPSMADVVWPLAEAVATETMQLCEGLSTLMPAVPPGPWPDAPTSAAVVPLKSHLAGRPAGALVVGISACLRPDERYMSFLELLGSQVATAVANARAYEGERRRAEALAEIDRVKTVFFSNVSHEFRTPLTLMFGPLEDALSLPETPASVRSHLELARRNAQRLLKLVNSLLDFARIEAGRVQASFVPVDLATLTADLASTFRSAMQRAELELEVDCQALGEPVYVDREMWEKIVLNLLSNALKFTMRGRVRVRLYREEGQAVLEVSDTGVGVPDHEIPHLFDRFHRVEGSEARTHEGSGIGLALVQELAKLHGGSSDATSRLGVGSTFRVRIPFGAEHLPPDRVRAASSPGPSASGARAYVQEALSWLPEGARDGATTVVVPEDGQHAVPDGRFAATFGARVLLADDNTDMRSYVRDLLAAQYEVEAVGDGAQALQAARRQRPDLVLADVMMPKLDGFELLQALRADGELYDVPVIMLSARAGEEARVEGLGAGADDYIAKPFHARELLARIGALLELTALRREGMEWQRHKLEEADRQKNEFLAMLAHELRNPLAPIRNASELLKHLVAQNPQAQRVVSIVQRQVAHLSRLVDDLLDVSRITQRRIELRQETVEVAEIVRQAVETVEPMIRERGHDLQIHSSYRALHVHGDVSRLVQCVVNLLTNAAKYTEPGGRIHISTRGQDQSAVIEVSDNGMGISPELLPKVFDLFVQSDRTLDRSQGGLGIGLSVVQRLIEMHGGEVVARSDGPERGSTFTILLPLARAPLPPDGDCKDGNVRPHRVLIVDDNADSADTLSMMLNLDGHATATAYSAREALAQVESWRPEVILLDIGLPGMDGYEVARRLRTMPAASSTRIVAVTGYGQPEDRVRVQREGFDAHMVKPINLQDLKKIFAAGP